MPPLVDPDGRSDPLGGETAPAHIITAQAGLVAPLDRGPLRLRTGLDRRELLFKPSAYCVRVLLVCPLQWLLRRVAPALEVVAHRAHRKLALIAALDHLPYCLPGPQRVRQLQLVGRFVGYDFLRVPLLLFGQGAALAFGSPRLLCRYGFQALGLIEPFDLAHSALRHAAEFSGGILGHALFKQATTCLRRSLSSGIESFLESFVCMKCRIQGSCQSDNYLLPDQ